MLEAKADTSLDFLRPDAITSFHVSRAIYCYRAAWVELEGVGGRVEAGARTGEGEERGRS